MRSICEIDREVQPNRELGIQTMPLPPDTHEFIQRWRKKRERYDLKKLEDCFDRFFTSYVLYNFLYELVALREGFEFDGDQEAAVKAARKFLGAEMLFADEVLQRESKVLVGLIEERTFYVRDTVWDAGRVAKLKTRDAEQWSKGLLEIVYRIRCNTFHGQKRFEEHQRQILDPCIRVLERLNDKLIAKLDT
jgi:nickel-dependent lactate racemase